MNIQIREYEVSLLCRSGGFEKTFTYYVKAASEGVAILKAKEDYLPVLWRKSFVNGTAEVWNRSAFATVAMAAQLSRKFAVQIAA